MVDAEHSYFQPCIDQAVLRLQRKFNKEYPAVFGTYQARGRRMTAARLPSSARPKPWLRLATAVWSNHVTVAYPHGQPCARLATAC